MNEMYILTPEESKSYLKQAQQGRYSIYRQLSEANRLGLDCTRKFVHVTDTSIQDLSRILADTIGIRDDSIPFTEEYPELVCKEIVKRIGPIDVWAEEPSSETESDRIVHFFLRNKEWRIAYRHISLYSLEWDGVPPYNHMWNILSFGWSNACRGEWTECMNPARAAELFLMLDDMAGYLDEEIPRIYQKVKKDSLCRHIRRVTKESLSNVDDAEPKA